MREVVVPFEPVPFAVSSADLHQLSLRQRTFPARERENRGANLKPEHVYVFSTERISALGVTGKGYLWNSQDPGFTPITTLLNSSRKDPVPSVMVIAGEAGAGKHALVESILYARGIPSENIATIDTRETEIKKFPAAVIIRNLSSLERLSQLALLREFRNQPSVPSAYTVTTTPERDPFAAVIPELKEVLPAPIEIPNLSATSNRTIELAIFIAARRAAALDIPQIAFTTGALEELVQIPKAFSTGGVKNLTAVVEDLMQTGISKLPKGKVLFITAKAVRESMLTRAVSIEDFEAFCRTRARNETGTVYENQVQVRFDEESRWFQVRFNPAPISTIAELPVNVPPAKTVPQKQVPSLNAVYDSPEGKLCFSLIVALLRAANVEGLQEYTTEGDSAVEKLTRYHKIRLLAYIESGAVATTAAKKAATVHNRKVTPDAICHAVGGGLTEALYLDGHVRKVFQETIQHNLKVLAKLSVQIQYDQVNEK